MPINKNNEKLSIDFGYIHQLEDGQELEYNLKFTHTEAGAVVQVLNGLYEPVELPAKMFLEVAEYLVGKGVLEGIKGASMAKVGSPLGKLSIPQIGNNSPSPKLKTLISPVNAISIQTEDEEVIEESSKATPPSKEEAELFKKQRVSALSKAKVEKKVKRTGETEDEE